MKTQSSIHKWRILVLDTKRSNPNHYIALCIWRALSNHPSVELAIQADYRLAISRAMAQKINLLIAFDGEQLEPTFIRRISALGIKTILWITEDPYEKQINVSNLGLFDLVFTNDSASVEAYGAKGRHLPLAADKKLHFLDIPESDQCHYFYDLFFAGTAWPNRSVFLESLYNDLPAINMKLALPVNPYIREPALHMEKSAYNWRTPNTQFAQFSNRSRSVLTLHRDFSGSGLETVSETPGPRFFEVALAGGFQLVDISIPQIRVSDFYQEGKDYIGFVGVKDCIEKLAYYLNNPKERLAIARSAQASTLNKHLYFNRIDYMLKEAYCLEACSNPEALVCSPARSRVLIVSHNVQGIKPYGGVEVYQEFLRNGLSLEYEFLFYTPDRAHNSINSRYVLRNENLEVIDTYACSSGIDDSLLACEEREKLFYELLQNHSIHLVHFQHLIGHAPSIALIPKVLGISTVLSLHDYYSVCTRFNLLDYRGSYCAIDRLSVSSCDVCLNASQGIAAGSQQRRRAFYARLLSDIDIIHANTEGVAEFFQRIYPNLRKRDNIRICGVPSPQIVATDLPKLPIESTDRSVLRIAIPGNFAYNKGADAIVHAMNQLRNDNVEFTIFGTIADQYKDLFSILRIQNLRFSGEYKPGSLPSLVRDFDLSLHYSIWPETYCISMSEVSSVGVIPIVANIGALGERISHGINGFKLPVNEPGAVVQRVRSLIMDPSPLERMRELARLNSGVTGDYHIVWLNGIYRLLIAEAVYPAKEEANYGLSLRDFGIGLVENTWVITESAVSLKESFADSVKVQMPRGRLSRLLDYYQVHGAYKTARAVVSKVRNKLKVLA